MSTCNYTCLSKDGCPPGVCPDFQIKRHDTKPSFVITVEDCDGPLDLEDCVVEASMWAKAKFKKAVTAADTYFAVADNIGFEQSLVGDIILIDRARAPEQMLVTGHDETNKFIRVQRGYNGTTAGAYKKGTPIRIFRMLNAVGDTKEISMSIEQVDGTTETEVVESQLVYEWNANDTCLPGCYWFEFKLLKMSTTSSMWLSAAAIVPTFTSVTPTDACGIGNGVEWVRRFPVDSDGFLIKVTDSPTAENVQA